MSAETKAGGIFKENSDGSTLMGFDVTNQLIELGGNITNTKNAGTPNTGVIATEYGTGKKHYTKLSFTDLEVGTAADGADLAFGVLLYTLPAGVQKIDAVYQEVALEGDAQSVADTPEIGLGTVIASGAVAVLGGTATFEDILEGSAAADVNGTTNIDSDLAVNQLVASGGAKTIHLNVADGWAASSDDDPVTATGTIILEWTDLTV